MAKNKHLTDSERMQIEHWLREGMSLKRIAVELGKSHSQFHAKSAPTQ